MVVPLPRILFRNPTLFSGVRGKGYSRKFTCRILHKTSSESREDGVLSHSRRASRDYMLWWCIKIRERE
jgi:hypothetical protein